MFPMGTSICPGGGLSWTLLFACVHQARYYVIVDPYTYSLMYGLPGARRVQPLVHRLLWRIYAETRQICARGASTVWQNVDCSMGEIVRARQGTRNWL